MIYYRETLMKISKHRCEIQQKFSETLNVSIQLIKKPIKFLKSLTKYMKKYKKKLNISKHDI